MSEWATHENEGGQEAPEQPEPPRVRSEHKENNLCPPMPIWSGWCMTLLRKSLLLWLPMRA